MPVRDAFSYNSCPALPDNLRKALTCLAMKSIVSRLAEICACIIIRLIASSSARGRPVTPLRDVWRCSGRLRPDASRHPSPSRTRTARPKMDVPGEALLAQARRSQAAALGGVSTMNPRRNHAVCSKPVNVTTCICRLLGYFPGTLPLSLTESKGCLTFHHAQLPGGSWKT